MSDLSQYYERYVNGDITDERYEEWMEALQDKYRMYIQNPSWTPAVEFSLWIVEGGEEFPVLRHTSRTGMRPENGITTYCSRDTDYGDHVELSDEFFQLIAYGLHEAMSFMPPVYFDNGRFRDSVEMWYGEQTRKHELFAAENLIHTFSGMGELPDGLNDELKPLARWCAAHTEFGVPVLEGGE